MKLIKLAILSFLFLFLLVTGISLFFPSQIRISKAVNLLANRDSVYQQLSIINNWKNWHPALKDLPNTDFQFPEAGTMKVKEDVIRIIGLKTNEIYSEFSKEGGQPVASGMKLITHPQSDSLTVQWYLDFKLSWLPWQKFKSLFYENIYGVQMEKGLANLKEFAERRRS
jgi:hypothetical protein